MLLLCPGCIGKGCRSGGIRRINWVRGLRLGGKGRGGLELWLCSIEPLFNHGAGLLNLIRILFALLWINLTRRSWGGRLL